MAGHAAPQHMTTQDTTTTEPQIQTVLVEIDTAESIRRGIAAPHSTAKIDLDLATLTADERDWVAARHSKGELRRYPNQGNLLKVACPRPACLLESIRATMAQESEAAAKEAAEKAAKEAEQAAKIAALKEAMLSGKGRFRQSSAVYDDCVYVDVDGIGNSAWLPRSPELEPLIAAHLTAEVEKKAAAEAEKKAKEDAVIAEAKALAEQQLQLIREHGTPEQIARLERGLMASPADEAQKILNKITWSKLLPKDEFPRYTGLTKAKIIEELVEYGDEQDYEVTIRERDLAALTDEQMAELLRVEAALPKTAVITPKEGYGHVDDDAVDGSITRPKLKIELPVGLMTAVTTVKLPVAE